MYTATISSKYQISIPKPIREELDIHVGQKFLFILKGNGLYLVPRLSIKEVKGLLKGIKCQNLESLRDRQE